MYEQKEKPKENKGRAVANSVVQKQSSSKQGIVFVDNRPETVAQRKLQEVANNTPRSKQTTQLQDVTKLIKPPIITCLFFQQ
jgi:replicative superfamily II helicase